MSSSEVPSSPKWETQVMPTKIRIPPRTSETVTLTVTPSDLVKSDDWTEVKFRVNIIGKKKSEELSVMVMIRKGTSQLKIKNVFSWPREFEKGERVVTSFKLENTGTVAARNVLVSLFINGKEKNKVEVTVPGGGYADIRLPWIAVRGKNDLNIKVLKQ